MVWKSSHLSMVTVANAERMWYESGAAPPFAFFARIFSTSRAARPVDWCTTDGCSASSWFSRNSFQLECWMMRKQLGTTSTSPSGARSHMRSEEHTSELQSHSDLVCRLLLEKKKNESKYWHLQRVLQADRFIEPTITAVELVRMYTRERMRLGIIERTAVALLLLRPCTVELS